MKYTEVFSKLIYEVATVVFIKKDGTIRIMLATRNINTVGLLYGFKGGVLGGYDKRCNINNGNIAIIDLITGEGRSFSAERIVSIYYHGLIETVAELDNVFENHETFKKEYEASQPKELTMDMLD